MPLLFYEASSKIRVACSKQFQGDVTCNSYPAKKIYTLLTIQLLTSLTDSIFQSY